MSRQPQTLSLQQAIDLAVQHHTSGRLSDAETMYQQILQTDPDQPIALHLLGVIAHQAGKNDKAFDLITKALSIKPDLAEAHYNLGNILKELGKLEEAVTNYQAALSLKPDHVQASYNIGNALQELGKLEAAVTNYQMAIAHQPNYAEAHNNLGVALQALGKLDEAVVCYRKVLHLSPDYAEAHYNLGIALEDLGKLDEAVACYRKAIDLRPDYADAHTNLGLARQIRNEFGLFRAKNLECLYALKRYEDFYLTLNEVIEIEKTNIRVAAISAFASQQLGREDPYPFCRNPLDFLHVSDIREVVSDADDLIGKLAEGLKHGNGILEPNRVTTRNGFQSQEDLFLKPTRELTRLNRVLKSLVDRYYAQYKTQNCVFIDLWPRENRLRACFGQLSETEHTPGYTHLDRWLSGILYLESPKKRTLNDGATTFSIHGYNYPILNDRYPKTLHNPKMGDIVLFPSSLSHKTVPKSSGSEALCIWFDLLTNMNKLIQ